MPRRSARPGTPHKAAITVGIRFISSWVLKYSSSRHALWNALIEGALVIILAARDLDATQQAGRRRA